MSDHFNQLSNSINEKILQEIESLNLPLLQKHHLRILLHCVQVFRDIAVQKNNNPLITDQDLRLWCELESSKFEDKAFSDLLFEQMSLARNKLEFFSNEINKNLLDLNISDLAQLTKENTELENE